MGLIEIVIAVSLVILGLFGYGKHQKKRAEKAEKQVINAKAYEQMRDVETNVRVIKENAYAAAASAKSVNNDRTERVDLGVYDSSGSRGSDD